MSNLPKEDLIPTKSKFWSSPLFSTVKKLVTTCSSSGQIRCDPPSFNKTKHVRLITIGPSHFCEKARWALDILNDTPSNPLFFTEDAHPPLLQSISTLDASNNKVSMVPMLVFEDDDGTEKIIHDSKEIVSYFCPFLYPDAHKDEIVRLETYFGSHVGATIRCYLYNLLICPDYYEPLAKMLSAQSSTIEKVLFMKLLPKGAGSGMKKVMGINPESGARSLKVIRQVFEEVSEMLKLKDGSKKKFIMDSETENVGFTAADLAFCSLASPLIQPPELKAFLVYNDDEMPPEMTALRNELRMTLAGQHVIDVYRKIRKTVVPKVATKQNFRWEEILAISKL